MKRKRTAKHRGRRVPRVFDRRNTRVGGESHVRCGEAAGSLIKNCQALKLTGFWYVFHRELYRKVTADMDGIASLSARTLFT